MSISIGRFLDGLSAAGALSNEDLAALQKAYPADGRDKSADDLARTLVQQSKLTRYQAAALYQGKVDTLVLGNYLLLDKLGAGGMGQVFRARHRRMDRVVALKVLPKKSLSSPDAVARFVREVKAAAKLTHPNIVTAHDADEAGSVHFLVMEYVDGRDLNSTVIKDGPLPTAKALQFIIGAAKGLQHAHAEGVVHRDIKPANLIVDKKGQLKILDMGLARLDDSSSAETPTPGGGDLTQAGLVSGTVDYMAPEQGLDMHTVTDRADIYSLGCTLFFLLTGKTPYSGDSMVRRLLAHRDSPIPSIRAIRPEVPEAVDKLFQRMVAKRPEDRPNATELLALLEGKPSAAAPVMLPRSVESPPSAQPATNPPPTKSKSPMLMLVGGGLAVAAVLAAVYVFLFSGGDSASTVEVAANTATPVESPIAMPAEPAKVPVAPEPAANPAVAKSEPVATSNPSTRSSPDDNKPIAPPVANASPMAAAVNAKSATEAPSPTSNPSSDQPVPAAPASVPAPAPAAQVALAPPPADAAPSPVGKLDPAIERRLAEWALGMGGKVEFVIEGQPPKIIIGKDQLPAQPFTVSAIEVPRNRKVNNESLKPLLELNRLSRLVVSETSINDGAFEFIIKMPWLTSLGVADTQITDAGIDVLAAHPKLEVLNASNTALTDRALQSLARCKGLRFVHVNNTKITDAGLLYLNDLPFLLGVSVGNCKVTDLGVKNLEPSAGITHLFLAGLSLTDTSVDILSRRTILKQLILRDTNVTDRSVEKLAGMTSLLELSVAGTQVSQGGFEKLKAALPACRLDWSPPKPVPAANDAPSVQRLVPIDTASRAPIPAASDQEKALQVLKDVFRDGYASAKKPDDKAALAEKLFKQASETRDDATSAYVMLVEARNLAVDAADAAMLVRIAQSLATRFEMSPWPSLVESLEMASQKSHPLAAFKAIAEAALNCIDESLDDDQFDAAKRLSDVALAAARKSKDAATLKAAVDRSKSLVALKTQWDAVEAAKVTLAAKSDDPEANLVLGRFLCFTKGDWKDGFAKLALSNDAALKDLAEKSLADPQDSSGQAELGEAWAKAADAAKGKAKTEFQAGARYWYAKALPVLTGLAKAKAEQRVKQLGAEESVGSRGTTAAARPVRRGAVSPLEQLARDRKGAEWVLGRRGKVGILYPGITSEQMVERAVDLPQHPFGLVKVDLFQDRELKDEDLVNLEGLTNLTNLRLEATPITDGALPHIAGLTNLTELSIATCKITDAGLVHLRGLKNLNTLLLGNSPPVTDAGMETIKGLTNITYLGLSNTRVTSTGWVSLRAFPRMQKLFLNHTPITNDAIEQLRAFPQLQELDLSFTTIDDAGLAKLAGMQQLTVLTLKNVKATDATITRLRAMLPQCKIQF